MHVVFKINKTYIPIKSPSPYGLHTNNVCYHCKSRVAKFNQIMIHFGDLKVTVIDRKKGSKTILKTKYWKVFVGKTIIRFHCEEQLVTFLM